MDFSICSYNCCSLNKNIDIVRELSSNKFSLIFLQETLVTEAKLGDLQFIDENYEIVGSGSVYSERALESNAGRSEGGLACLWLKKAPFKVEKVTIERNFVIMSVIINSVTIIFVNVYIRSDLWEIHTLNDYLESLSELENIIDSTKFDSIFFIGDFNADPSSGRAWSNLNDFINRNNLRCFDVDRLEGDTFTFLSYGNSYSRWLDQIVGRTCDNVTLANVEVLHEKLGSDHFPIVGRLRVGNVVLPLANSIINKEDNIQRKVVNWEKLNSTEFSEIENTAIESLIQFMHCESLICSRLGCRNELHWKQLEDIYHTLAHSLLIGKNNFARDVIKKDKFKVIPGWNRSIKHLHAYARFRYLEWLRIGKARDCTEFELMKESRTAFKTALNNCKANEKREKSLSIKEKFENKSMTSFWKEIQHSNNKIKHSNIIDGKSETVDIINIFTQKFLDFDSLNNECSENELLSVLKSNWLSKTKFHINLSPETLKKLITKLSVGEGHDGIHTLFLRRASDKLLEILSKFITACYSHCCVPVNLLSGDINPTIKDTKGNSTESSNYRPVMQSSCILKIFEIHILQVFEEKLHFHSRQFGFKLHTSTTDACLVLKETVNKYITKGGKTFCLFVDLSKAFDNVNHFKLGKLLLKRNIPPDIVLFMMF